MCIGLYIKHSLLLSDFNKNLNFLDRFSKNTQVSDFMKIRSVGAELYDADRRTDKHDEVTVAFRSFTNVPEEHTITSQ